MKYLMLVCTDATGEPNDIDIEEWADYVHNRGVWVIGDRIRPAGDSTTVRVRGGQLMVSDGPFAETKEQICGFDVLECADLDDAIEVARRHPMATGGQIELRPFWPL